MSKSPEFDSIKPVVPQSSADSSLGHFVLPWLPRPIPTSLPPEEEKPFATPWEQARARAMQPKAHR